MLLVFSPLLTQEGQKNLTNHHACLRGQHSLQHWFKNTPTALLDYNQRLCWAITKSPGGILPKIAGG